MSKFYFNRRWDKSKCLNNAFKTIIIIIIIITPREEYGGNLLVCMVIFIR